MKAKISVYVLLATYVFSACEKSEFRTPNVDIGEIHNHLVTLEQAQKVAVLDAMFRPKLKSGENTITLSMDIDPSTLKSSKNIESFLSVNFQQKDPSLYIFNFEEGGFSIVSGDDRLAPILAYSDTGTFPIDSNLSYPAGLIGWLSTTNEIVKVVRNEKLSQAEQIKAEWEAMNFRSDIVMGTNSYQPPPECTYDGQIHYFSESHGPFLSTTWAQGVGYNNALTNMGCSSYSNGRPPTGCVATAVAQVMKYHQHPTSYNWALMPNNTGSSTTATLMANIGTAVSMDYDCNGSGTQTSIAATALKNTFGYTSAVWNSTYTPHVVFNNIREGRPVILSGGRKDKWWFFNVYADGHAWVADGYNGGGQEICHKWEDDGDPYTTEYEWLPNGFFNRLHINWGWGGTYDGYYDANGFNPGSNTFNYKNGMIVSIIP
ncbi:C10 family peptidase [Parapedobacter sp. GCM10030251]|uniref:C10 family peptidase n=1 Tax=Parapedobacter sp. GCM10030251 TaxID=3273419 RepID=UPI003608A9BE